MSATLGRASRLDWVFDRPDTILRVAPRGRREEYSESTRNALISAASELIMERGYANTSLEEVARIARVSKGAVYHHFNGKQALFEALFERVTRDAIKRVKARVEAQPDPGNRSVAGLNEFFEVCLDPVYRRIALQEGPLALGWERWRKLDGAQTHELVRQSVIELRNQRLLRPVSVELFTAVMTGAIHEVAFVISKSENPRRTRSDAIKLFLHIATALRRKKAPGRARREDSGSQEGGS